MILQTILNLQFTGAQGSPALDYPQHAGYFFNLNLAEYIRALPS